MHTTYRTPQDPLRTGARSLLTNDRIFDLFGWLYATMTINPVWMGNSARLLDDVAGPADGQRLRVLDLGAGPGNSAIAMGERRADADFIALDLAPQMLIMAQKNRSRAGWTSERLSPLLGNGERLPLADASVDVVTAHSFLYLVDDCRAVLREVRRVVRPGGGVAFLEPGSSPPDWGWLWRSGDWGLISSLSLWQLYSWTHGRFSAQSLHGLLAESGFVQITTEETLGRFGLFGRAVRP